MRRIYQLLVALFLVVVVAVGTVLTLGLKAPLTAVPNLGLTAPVVGVARLGQWCISPLLAVISFLVAPVLRFLQYVPAPNVSLLGQFTLERNRHPSDTHRQENLGTEKGGVASTGRGPERGPNPR